MTDFFRTTVVCLFWWTGVLHAQSSAETLERFTSAFNERKIESMMPMVSDSVQWFSVAGDSMTTEITGAPALERWLKGYFQSCPSCRSEFVSVHENGDFVSVVEKATWKGKNGERSQQSIGVYEIRNAKIRRVWYFPAR